MDRELEKILEEMQKEFGKFTKLLSSTNKQIVKSTKTEKEEAEAKKRLKRSMFDYLQELKAGKPVMFEFTEAVEDAEEELGSFKKTLKGIPSPMNLLKKGFDLVKGAAMKLGGALIKTAYNFGKTSSNIKNFQDAVGAGMSDLDGIGPVADKLAQELDENIEMLRGLAQSGATFDTSIGSMREAATRAGMPLLQFQELIQDNTQVLAKMFGSVNQGIPEFVELGRGLRHFQQTELAGFGVTMEEANEFLGTFTELQRAQGRSERMTATQLLEGTKQYAKNLTTLSRLTGQSVRELDAQNRARATDGVLQAKLAQMSTEDAIKFQKVLDLFPAGAQQAVKELGLLGVPVTEAGKALQVLSGGAVQDIIKSAMGTTGKLSDEATVALSNRIKTLSTDIQQSSLADAFATAGLAGGDAFFSEGLNIITAMAGSAADIKKFTATTAAAQVESPTKALMQVKGALDLNTTAVQEFTTGLLDKFVLDQDSAGAKIIQGFVDDAGKFTESMVDKINKYFGLGKHDKTGDGDTDKKKVEPFTLDDMPFGSLSANKGTGGFKEFGTGTPAVLHGSEAVVPERSNLGSALSMLETIAKNPSSKSESVVNNTTTNSASTAGVDMTALNVNTEKLIALTEKTANHLNTLVTIGAMTEKNTKDTKINIANIGGSLV